MDRVIKNISIFIVILLAVMSVIFYHIQAVHPGYLEDLSDRIGNTYLAYYLTAGR